MQSEPKSWKLSVLASYLWQVQGDARKVSVQIDAEWTIGRLISYNRWLV